jgi:hypothetical protein
MTGLPRLSFLLKCSLAATLLVHTPLGRAQEPPGPQTSAPPPRTRENGAATTGFFVQIKIICWKRFAVVLENGISTRGAKAGDSVYFTLLPITQNNHVIIPVGSYLRGELIEPAARPHQGRAASLHAFDT